MFSHSTNTSSFFAVLVTALIFSLSLTGVAAAQNNTSLGIGALENNTTGNFNTASGFIALFSNTTGSFNTASGADALLLNTTGRVNTASGVDALFSNTTGNINTASGVSALRSNTTGNDNTASGVDALFSNTTGDNNTASGVSALRSNTTGNGNIALGFNSGSNLTTGSNNIAIGNLGVAGESNTIRIGDPNTHTTTVLSGTIGIGTTNPTRAKVEINGFFGSWSGGPGQVLTSGGNVAFAASTFGGASLYASSQIAASSFAAFSDERIKRIEGRSDAARDLATLAGIEVTDYTYVDTVTNGTGKHKKVIAQQVEEVYPLAVSRSTDIVPDIYQKARIEDGWVKLPTNLKRGERVRLIGKNNEGIHEVLEVAEDKFRTEFAADSDEVFVYGREVKDFRNVDYNAITMLNVSATQELNHRLEKQAADLVAQAKEMSKQSARIAELEQDRLAQATRIAELEKQASEIAMLKQQMTALQAGGRLDAAQLAAAR